jgi:hypothetical protein
MIGWRVAENILNEQSRAAENGSSSSLGALTWSSQLLNVKNKLVTKCHKRARTWMDSSDKRLKIRNMDMRFGTLNVRSLYRAGSLMTVAKEILKYKFDLVGVQDVR